MIVMKFGGSSVSDAARIDRVAKIVRGKLKQKPVVVVSAFRGVTDELLALAREAQKGNVGRLEAIEKRHRDTAAALGVSAYSVEPLLAELKDLAHGIALLGEASPAALDKTAGFGERLSARLIAAYFDKAGIPAQACDAPAYGLLTDARHGEANPIPEAEKALRSKFARVKKLPIVTGFIGKTKAGAITTLGRNGSDYTATILGAALGATEVQIWSDTDGVMTADPRMAPAAKPLSRLSFAEAGELAYYGGRVLHPHTLVPAVKKRIPVRVLNTFKPRHPGTKILAGRAKERGVKSIAFKRGQIMVTVASPDMLMRHGFLARLFDVFARHEISLNMVTTSEVTVSMTVDSPKRLDLAVRDLQKEFSVVVEKGKAVVCVVGEGIRGTPGVAAAVFGAVKDAGVNVLMISQGASKINVAFIVDDQDVERAVRALHRRFFER
jgi:aspartate kinase